MHHRTMLYPGGSYKAVTLSYDDGSLYDIRFAQTLDKYGIKCTFNLCSAFIRSKAEEKSWYLSAEEIKTHLLDKGHEIAVHCAHHRAPGCVRPIEGIREVLDGRQGLEDTFSLTVRGMAYPDSGIRYFMNGASKENVFNYLSDLGIIYARSLGADNDSFDLPTNWLEWFPTAHHTNPELYEYIDKFLKISFESDYPASRRPKLFYLWGHSFEFERDNNWDHLEDICSRLSGHNDIWYATNTEIYEYVNAYDSLIYNVSETTVFNPTLIDIWLNIDGTTYTVPSGKTIQLK